MKLGCSLEDQEGSAEGDVDRRNMPGHIHRMPIGPPAEEGPTPEKQVYATKSGEPRCHDVVRKARAWELKHIQHHNVFDVVWLSEVKSLTKVRSKWLQDMKGDVAKARFVAQVHRIVRHDSSIRSLTNRRAHCSHSTAGIV